jgi:hypothetical protein
MTEIPESRWLFTRGSQRIRLVRQEHPKGCRLCLYGPGTESLVYDFGDLTECMKRQAEIEQSLLAEGYQMASRSSDRRSEPGLEHAAARSPS